MFVTRRTFADFAFPEPCNPGIPAYNPTYTCLEVPAGDRDPAVPTHPDGQPPENVFAVRFFDLVVAEVPDPVSGILVECRSERLDQSPWHYYRGTVLDQDSIQKALPTLLYQIAKVNMMTTRDAWKACIYVDGILLPFDPAKDSVA